MAEKKGLTPEEISKLGPAARAQIAASMVNDAVVPPEQPSRQEKSSSRLEAAAKRLEAASASLESTSTNLKTLADKLSQFDGKPFRGAASQWPPIPPRGPDGKFMPWGAMPMAPLYASNNQEKREHQSDDRKKEQREQDRKRMFAAMDRRLSKISDGVDKTNLKLDDLIAVNTKILERAASTPVAKQNGVWEAIKTALGVGTGAATGAALKGAASTAAEAGAGVVAAEAGAAGKKLGFAARAGRGIGLGILGDLAGGGLHYGAEALDSSGYKKTAAATDILGYTAQGAGWGAALGTVVPGIGNMVGAGGGAAIGGLYGLYMRGKAAFGYEDEPAPPVNNNVTGGGFGGEEATVQPQSHMLSDPSKSGAIQALEARTKEIKSDSTEKIVKGNEINFDAQTFKIGSKTGGQVIKFESPQIIFEADKFEFVTRGGKGGGSGGSPSETQSNYTPSGNAGPGSGPGGGSGGMPGGNGPTSQSGPGASGNYGSNGTQSGPAGKNDGSTGETLKDVNPHQLAFIRGLGATESGFSRREAYSEALNQPHNNANVRKYGSRGADYGYYQTNEMDVDDAIRRGVPPEIARHLNGGGRGGQSTMEQQTLAMHEYLKRKYPKEYDALKSGDPRAFQSAMSRMSGQWFGLRDAPQKAMREFAKGATGDMYKIYPEMRQGGDSAEAGPSGSYDRVSESQSRTAAIRKQPISPQLKEIMQYAAEKAGVQVDVTSGGQDSHGPNRTGSHRHDHGGAGDADLYVIENGKRRKLDFNQYADRQKYEDFVMHSRAAGATGIGAGEEYMGTSKLHVGFGGEATWGSAAGGWLGRSYKIGARMGPEEFQKWRQARAEAQKQQTAEASKPTPTTPAVPKWQASMVDDFMKDYKPMDEDRARQVQQEAQARLAASVQQNRAQKVAAATQEEAIKPRGSTVGQIDPADWERARRSQDEMRRDPEGAKGRSRMEMENRNDQSAKEEKVGDVGQPDAYLSSLFDTWSPSVLGTMKTG